METAFARAWRDYRLLLCIGLLYGVLCTWQAFEVGLTAEGYLRWSWMTFRNIVKFVYVFFAIMLLCVYGREFVRARCNFKKAGASFGAWLSEYISSDVFAGGMLGLVAAYESVFFLLQKSTVRWVNPWAWDQKFEAWDRALHFGRHPYEWLFDAFAGGRFDTFMQAAYIGWFGFMYLGLGWALFVDRNRFRKLRFVSVFLLGWALLGGIGASILSSVCPVFYHLFYPDQPDAYAALNAYLAAHADDLAAIIYVQNKLLEWNANPAVIIPNGIAAMPSMHAAISTLVTIYTWSINRYVFAVTLFCAVSIVVSSIYLGFHYAIDSYFSILCIGFMWWASGRIIAWREKPAA